MRYICVSHAVFAYADIKPEPTVLHVESTQLGKEELGAEYRKLAKHWRESGENLSTGVTASEVMRQISLSDDPVGAGRMVILASPLVGVVPSADMRDEYLSMMNSISMKITAQADSILTYQTVENQQQVIADILATTEPPSFSTITITLQLSDDQIFLRKLRHELDEYESSSNIVAEINKRLVGGVTRAFEGLDLAEQQLLAKKIQLDLNEPVLHQLEEQGVIFQTNHRANDAEPIEG